MKVTAAVIGSGDGVDVGVVKGVSAKGTGERAGRIVRDMTAEPDLAEGVLLITDPEVGDGAGEGLKLGAGKVVLASGVAVEAELFAEGVLKAPLTDEMVVLLTTLVREVELVVSASPPRARRVARER